MSATVAEAEANAFLADHPHRLFCRPERPAAGAQVACVWEPTPWQPETLAGILAALIGGGGVYLLAREAGELVLMREAVELLLADEGGSS